MRTYTQSLEGIDKKMSASSETSAIYVTDSPAVVEEKIKKHAFSGGRDTAEKQVCVVVDGCCFANDVDADRTRRRSSR